MAAFITYPKVVASSTIALLLIILVLVLLIVRRGPASSTKSSKKQRDTVVLVGPSDAGKTVLLHQVRRTWPTLIKNAIKTKRQ